MLVCFYGKIEQQEYDGDWSQLKASGERLIEIFIWKETDRHVWHFDLKVHCVGFSALSSVCTLQPTWHTSPLPPL